MDEHKTKKKRDTSYRKGVFNCPLCSRQFAHSASLSRHRLKVHNGCHYCIQCKETIPASTTLRSHFLLIHTISGVVTCACCNWAFIDKKTLHAHIKSTAKGWELSLDGVLAITGADIARMAELETEVSSPTVSPSDTVSSSPPSPLLPSIEVIQSEDWQIPIGITESSPDFSLLVEELMKDNNLMIEILTSTQQEHYQLNELVNSIFPQDTMTSTLDPISLASPSLISSNNKRKRKSIDEVANYLLEKKTAEMKE